MASITVAQVSGLIALGTFGLQAILPLATLAILVSFLRNEHTAVTWSCVSRSIQASLWPEILRTDSVSRRNVKLHVSALSWLNTISWILLAIAGVITPLGLSDKVNPGNSMQMHFQYAQDPSSFGYGTPPRYNHFSRLCGAIWLLNCPGAYAGYQTFRNETGWHILPDFQGAIINSTIPANLTEIFSSATSDEGNTLSGVFDIQYRTWAVADGTKKLDGGKPLVKGSFRIIDTLILHNKTEAIEGIIVDTTNGGVGYRNHTIPSRLQYGGTWSENLTWIEPVSVCVDTNLTFRYDLPAAGPLLPWWTMNPDLLARASQAAYMSNMLTAYYLNVSYPGDNGSWNSSKGAEYILPTSIYSHSITLDELNGGYLDLPSQTEPPITEYDFATVAARCQGWGLDDNANITNTLIRCGYLYGAARRSDGGESLILEPNSIWTQNLYVCATGIRASVKTVHFRVDSTSSLSNLNVVNVEDNLYSNDSSKPLWGVEDSNLTIKDINPLWGLVNNRYETAKGLWTIRTDKFWLPAVSNVQSHSTFGPRDNLASASVFGEALATTLESATGNSTLFMRDYSGANNMPLSRLWKELSVSPSSASKIINLIFSDILASATVGTKSALMASASGANTGKPNALAYVTEYTRQVQYDLRYAIPALIVLSITVIALFVAFGLFILSRFSLTAMRQLLNQTSTGRVATNLLYPDLCEPTAPTSEWNNKAGRTKLVFSVFPVDQARGPPKLINSQSHP